MWKFERSRGLLGEESVSERLIKLIYWSMGSCWERKKLKIQELGREDSGGEPEVRVKAKP